MTTNILEKEILEKKSILGNVGLVGRFRPLHNGAALMLDYVCKNADHLYLGIGSANKKPNVRNPFTAQETVEMIDLYLKPKFNNYEFLLIPDFAKNEPGEDGNEWKNYVFQTYGNIDTFVTGNPYVASLLESKYKIIHPSEIIPRDKWFKLRGTMVRVAMAQGDEYKTMVPEIVSKYLEDNLLVQRFRKDYGLQTLELLSGDSWYKDDTLDQEKNNTMKG